MSWKRTIVITIICIVICILLFVIGFSINNYVRDYALRIAENTNKNIPKREIHICDYIDITQPIEYSYFMVSVVSQGNLIMYDIGDDSQSEVKTESKRTEIFHPYTESYLGLIETLWNTTCIEYVSGRDGGNVWVMRKDSPIPHIGPGVSVLRQKYNNSFTEITILEFGIIIIKRSTGEVMRCRSDIDLFYTLMLARPSDK